MYVLDVAPEIAVPSLRHWYDNVPLPLAVTAHVTLLPAATLWALGCVVIEGAVLLDELLEDVSLDDVPIEIEPPPHPLNDDTTRAATNAGTTPHDRAPEREL